MNMRAKMKVMKVDRVETQDRIMLACVAAKSYEGAPNGVHEDNTFSKYSPTGELTMTITNPALLGKLVPGDLYYIDFVPVPEDKR